MILFCSYSENGLPTFVITEPTRIAGRSYTKAEYQMNGFAKFLFAPFLAVVLISCSHGPRVALIYETSRDVELDSLCSLLCRKGYDCTPVDIASEDFSLDGYSLAWYHRSDSARISIQENAAASVIVPWTENGGKLVLSMDAVRLPSAWGLEGVSPSLKYVDAVDEGFGRKLGYHAFREHPLFDGLFGGAYVWHGYEDNRNRVLGYFGESLPSSPDSRIIATLWEYIYYQPQSKVIWEQPLGKGTILNVGAFLYYSMPNAHRPILERFTENVVDCLLGEAADCKSRYWTYGPVDVTFSGNAAACKPSVAKSPVHWTLEDDSEELRFTAGREEVVLAGKRVMLVSEERGGIKEIWTHPVMSVKNYRAKAWKNGAATILDSPCGNVVLSGNSLIRSYMIGGKTKLREILSVAPADPVSLVHYEWTGDAVDSLTVEFSSNMRYMWPYDEDALGSLHCSVADDCYIISDSEGEFCSALGVNLPWRLLSCRRHGDFVQADMVISVDAGGAEACDVAMVSTGKGPKKTLRTLRSALKSPSSVHESSRSALEKYIQNTVRIETPEPDFNRGYTWAMRSLSTFLAETPGLGEGLMAGYASSLRGWGGGHRVSGRPGYAWYFGRDSELAAFAYLAAGDFESVRSTIKLLSDFQSENGQVFHELTTSGSVHYDASDATPLLPVLIYEYWKASGDEDFVRSLMPNVRKAMDFCFTTDTDGDHLIEIEHVGHGWLEGGDYFTLRTEFYLSGIWLKALELSAELEDTFGDDAVASRYRAEMLLVKPAVEAFWNEKGGYYNYGLNPDHTYSTSQLALASVPVWLGVTDSARAYESVCKYAGDGFSTDWGVRQTSDPRPQENVGAYDESNIWPLFTGSVSLAEYCTGRYSQAFDHMMASLLCYRSATHGRVPEVIRGNRFVSGGITRDQCWSETAVVGPAIAGMLGWKSDATKSEITLAPRIPFDWNCLAVDNLRSADAVLSFDMMKSDGKAVYDFDATGERMVHFEPALPPGSKVLSVKVDGQDVPWRLCDIEEYSVLKLDFMLRRGRTSVEIVADEGPSVLPSWRYAGDSGISEGIRILSQRYDGETLTVEVEGKKHSSPVLNLYIGGEKRSMNVDFGNSTRQTIKVINK